jgi:hypothetical protein
MNINLFKEPKGSQESTKLFTVIHLDEDSMSDTYVELWRADDYAHLMAQLTKAGVEIFNTVLNEFGVISGN